MALHTSDAYDLSALAEQYPRTVAAFDAMGALDHLERIARLDAVWRHIRATNERSTTNDQGERSSEAASRLPPRVSRLPPPTSRLPPPASHLPPPTSSYAQSSHINYHAPDYDLIYAGGGLGLIHAAVMARRYNARVLLFDRGEVGCAHREWNISREELAALVEIGFCTWNDLRDIVMTEYETGVVRFYAGPDQQPNELWMQHVLDVALDAGALLQFARRQLEAAGGTVLDHRVFQRVSVSDTGPVQVAVEVQGNDGTTERHTARLLLDGMGSISPLALARFGGQPFTGVCPTVGTVVEGVAPGDAPNEHNPRVGDILLSVAHSQRGQQYMWEGFPGRGDELTVYLFYYDTLANDHRPINNDALSLGGDRSSPSLLELFEDYFALLPTYKKPGPHFRHCKPVYGYIPARHSVRRQEMPLLRGVLPIGDSAAQQSPLTFCGFGSHVRNLSRTTVLLHAALQHDLLDPQHLRLVSPYQVNVSLNWVFSRFMQPWRATDDVNRVQNVFLQVLNQYGEPFARRFFRDQMHWGDYHRMVLGMFWRYPRIVLDAWRVLGPRGCAQWASDYAVFSGAALLARVGQRLGVRGRIGLLCAAERFSASLGFWLRARYAEWRAMGWTHDG